MDLIAKGVPLIDADTLEKDLNRQLMKPSFAASALDGTNVAVTLKKIISMTVESVKNNLL